MKKISIFFFMFTRLGSASSSLARYQWSQKYFVFSYLQVLSIIYLSFYPSFWGFPLWLNLDQMNNVCEYIAETCVVHPCLTICLHLLWLKFRLEDFSGRLSLPVQDRPSLSEGAAQTRCGHRLLTHLLVLMGTQSIPLTALVNMCLMQCVKCWRFLSVL